MVRPVNSRSRGSLLLLISYEVSSLIRNSAGWNIMMVDRHSVSSQTVVLAEALCARKPNSYPEGLFHEEQNVACFWMEVVQCNQLATSSWLITPGNGAIWGSQCWSLLLAD